MLNTKSKIAYNFVVFRMQHNESDQLNLQCMLKNEENLFSF